jgi:hypothetical protein
VIRFLVFSDGTRIRAAAAAATGAQPRPAPSLTGLAERVAAEEKDFKNARLSAKAAANLRILHPWHLHVNAAHQNPHPHPFCPPSASPLPPPQPPPLSPPPHPWPRPSGSSSCRGRCSCACGRASALRRQKLRPCRRTGGLVALWIGLHQGGAPEGVREGLRVAFLGGKASLFGRLGWLGQRRGPCTGRAVRKGSEQFY